MIHAFSALFNDPRIDYPICDQNLSFSDYILQSESIIANTRLDLQGKDAAKIIKANSPFELRPKNQGKIRHGALLVHGLFDSPFVMREIGNHLQNDGLLVRAVLLPGHGTIPGALLHVSYHQWLQTIQYGIQTLLQEVERVFLVGFSTGGSLVLLQAFQNAERVAGLILLSPAIKIRSSFDFTSSWHKIISWAWKRAAWFHIDHNETIDYAKYRSLPFNAIHQVYELSKQLHKINGLSCPLFFALSFEDITVCSRASIRYFQQHTHPKSQMILYHYADVNLSNDSRIILRNSHFPQMNIYDLSHPSIPRSPNNMHYGEKGDYPDASHIFQEKNVIYGEFNLIQTKWNNLLYQLGLTKHRCKRLSFNPDFAFLMDSIKHFVMNI